MKTSSLAVMLFTAISLLSPAALQAKVYGDTVRIPERVIFLTGEPGTQHEENIAIMYSREGLAFDEPSAPRFLFLDREGKVALGIGGDIKALAYYDFDGGIDGSGFTTYDIAAPLDPSFREQLGADVSHSSIFLKLVTKSSRLGKVQVYFQSGFTAGYGFKLKQAYITAGHVTVGLARSTFSDGEAVAPTVDPQGPTGQISAKNVLLQYKTSKCKGWSAAVSLEVPDADYTTSGSTEAIHQRVPDIPIYVQYDWNKESHIRLSAIMRQLSYRDVATSANHFAAGWGVQLSGVGDLVGNLGYFGHVAYGKGIARYVNDLSGAGYDLIPSATAGEMKAPGTMAWTAGLSYNFSKDFFMTANYSQTRLYDISTMAGDSYRYAQYAAVNGFYNLTGDLRIGAECVIGWRHNLDGTSGHAHRLDAILQYSF